jgi:hypothetical protein
LNDIRSRADYRRTLPQVPASSLMGEKEKLWKLKNLN